ncbi:MAG: cation:proton antiporter, partial [Myxococcota bacterium]
MPAITGIVFGVLAVGFVLRKLKQPHVIVYLIAGIILGPSGLRLVEDNAIIDRVGALGMLLLLFFIGMEVSVAKLVELWRVAVIGTGAQIMVSVGLTAMIGLFLDWTWARIVLLGFVISLSSTAVV